MHIFLVISKGSNSAQREATVQKETIMLRQTVTQATAIFLYYICGIIKIPLSLNNVTLLHVLFLSDVPTKFDDGNIWFAKYKRES